jgi:hypothetical protein
VWLSLAAAVCGGTRDGGVCAGAGFSRPERRGARDRTNLCAANAGAVVFDHGRFRRQVRLTIEGAPDSATLANVIGALTARDRWR